MANTVSNVTVGKPAIGGAIFRAPIGTALPNNATAALNEAFKSLGYISDAGLTNANGIETQEFHAWGGDHVLSEQTGRTDTFQFVAIETLNDEVLKSYYGDNAVSGSLATGITVSANAKDLEAHSYVIDMLMRDGALKRVVIPNGKVSATGDVVYVDNEPVGYDMTIAALVDASGNSHYEYIVRSST